jgi:uncharacterized protein YjlB
MSSARRPVTIGNANAAGKMNQTGPEIISRLFKDDGRFPNNGNLPLVIFKSVLGADTVSPEQFEKTFTENGWPAAWRNGLFDAHHYHSSAHEVLGVYSGWVQGCFGGPEGEIFEAQAGDVIIIPAGVSHCNKGQSPDFKVVGGYPAGQSWDMKYGAPDDRPGADHNIRSVTTPDSDPFFGSDGPLINLWR